MKTGISKNMQGYNEIDVNGAVTVRSEVARLTRLYDRAVRTNTINNPDMYQGDGAAAGPGAALKLHPPATGGTAAPADQAAVIPAPTTTIAPDPDESPATSVPQLKKEDDKPAPEAESSKPKTDSNGTDPKPDAEAGPATTDDKGKAKATE